MLRVFVSTNYELRAIVRVLQAALCALGFVPVSRWVHEPGDGPESLLPVTHADLASLRERAHQNDRDIASAHVMLVIGTSRGGEHLAESRLARSIDPDATAGEGDAVIVCGDHARSLRGIAAAIGLHVQLIPMPPPAKETP